MGFKISLHVTNIQCLYYIKTQLGVGSVNKSGTMASFVLRKRELLHDVIFPIFEANPLLTKKYHDFVELKCAYTILISEKLTKVEKDREMLAVVERLRAAGIYAKLSPV